MSYLRQFSTITKEMSVDKRVDVFTDASLHYGEHLFYRFGMKKHIPSAHSSPLCDGYFFLLSFKVKCGTCICFCNTLTHFYCSCYKIIILAVPTMIAKLKKASTLTSRSGNLLLDSIQGSSANAKNGCLANVVHRTSIFHQK